VVVVVVVVVIRIPKVDEHLRDALDEAAVDGLSDALLVDELEERIEQALLDARRAGDVLAKELEPKVVDGHLALLHDVHAVL